MTMGRIKKGLLLITAFLVFIPTFFASEKETEELFDLARQQLAKREIESALISLRHIYRNDLANSNINFLMGAAYTELGGNSDRAIFHLKKALKSVSEDYKVGDYKEKNAPVHAYYYLTVALSDQDECSKAAAAFNKLKNYNSIIDLYFIDEAERHMQKCPYEKIDKGFDMWLSSNDTPEGYDPDFLPIDNLDQKLDTLKQNLLLANLDSSRKAEMGVVTRELEYSTSAPLYGVQIGSNTKPSPISTYGKLKNVDVFIDKEGMVRYVIGHFAYKKQAESLLEKLKGQGFPDAFVVNVNGERKYSNELISFGNINLRAGIKGEVDYYLQLGAFKDSVPDHLMQMYLTVDNIRELKYRELTLMAVGPFTTYKTCLQKKDELQDSEIEGIKKAFIVAFNRGEKITLQDAIDYTD